MRESVLIIDDAEILKICAKCKQSKSLDQFHKSPCNSGGVHTYCKDCTKTRDARRTPAQTKRNNLRNMYGMTEDDYTYLMDAQDGLCYLCEKAFLLMPRTVPDIDHYHGHHHIRKAQKGCLECIRGLLCNRCNMVLGLMEDCQHLQNDLVKTYLQRRPLMYRIILS